MKADLEADYGIRGPLRIYVGTTRELKLCLDAGGNDRVQSQAAAALINMANFVKSLECPSSADLADYQSGYLAAENRPNIDEHLLSCEFCRAETAFYRLYPPLKSECVAAPPIPSPLNGLARAIFRNGK